MPDHDRHLGMSAALTLAHHFPEILHEDELLGCYLAQLTFLWEIIDKLYQPCSK